MSSEHTRRPKLRRYVHRVSLRLDEELHRELAEALERVKRETGKDLAVSELVRVILRYSLRNHFNEIIDTLKLLD